MNKTISVVMCTYNGAKYLKEQLDSILAQTYPATEIVVQDDCSTDATFEILTDYAARYPQIRIIRNEQRLGVKQNFLSAVCKASCDYIASSDQDDIWEPNKLELQINAIGNHLLCTGTTIPFSTNGIKVSSDIRTPNHSLLRQCYVPCLAGHTFLYDRKLNDIMFSILPPPSNWDVVLAIIAEAYDEIVFVDKPLVHWRRHDNAASYCKPVDNRHSFGNVIKHLFLTLSLFFEMRPMIMEHARKQYESLSSMKSDKPILKEAIYMMKLQSEGSFFSYLKLSLFCYKHQTELFFVHTRKNFLNGLRALYFPIFVSFYFRFGSKRYKK